MHPCLHISEMQNAICVQLHSSENAGTLLSLALSCKAFLIPAMTILWDEQGSILPLLRCIPENKWSRNWESSRSFDSRRLTFRKEDWDRPLFYSRFITKITFSRNSEDTSDEIEDDNLRPLLLSLTLLSSPLLPNLRTLDCSSDYDFETHDDNTIPSHDNELGYYAGQLEIIAASLGSRLSHLSFFHDIIEGGDFPIAMIGVIVAKSPNLLTLNIVHEDLGAHISEDACFTNILQSCRELRSVSIGKVHPSVIVALSQLPNLEVLTLCKSVRADLLQLGNQIQLSGRRFPALKFLRIQKFSHSRDFLSLFEMIKYSSLIGIDITLSRAELNLHKIFTSLSPATTNFLQSLTTFSLESDNRPGLLYLISQTIQWLAHFPRVEHFDIVTPIPYPITNEELSSIAGAWRNLTTLHLRDRDEHPTLPHATIMGLRPLAENCPRLEEVMICIDAATAIPPLTLQSQVMERRRSEFTHQIPISFLFFSSPITEDHIPVAACLLDMFWNPRVVNYYDWDSEAFPEEDLNGVKMGTWNRVSDRLREVVEERQLLL